MFVCVQMSIKCVEILFGSDVCVKAVDQLDVGFVNFFLCHNTGKNLRLFGFCLVNESVSGSHTRGGTLCLTEWLCLRKKSVVDKLTTSLNKF